MPELPEVETVRRGLRPVLEGQRVARLRTFRADLRIPFPSGLGQRLTGRRIEAVERRSKYLLIRVTGDDVMILHLGMSGSIRILPSPPPPRGPHDHLELTTDAGTVIRFNDPRRFGLVTLARAEELQDHPLLRDIGPEPLDPRFDAGALAQRLKGKRTSIKAALLDQRVVAGVGNIYAAEALFRAGLSPKRSAHTVQGARAERLVGAIKAVLNEAIAAGGSTLRDHRQPDGELGYFQHTFQVYDREGEHCAACTCSGSEKSGIRRIVQQGRSTFYCPHTQR